MANEDPYCLQFIFEGDVRAPPVKTYSVEPTDHVLIPNGKNIAMLKFGISNEHFSRTNLVQVKARDKQENSIAEIEGSKPSLVTEYREIELEMSEHIVSAAVESNGKLHNILSPVF